MSNFKSLFSRLFGMVHSPHDHASSIVSAKNVSVRYNSELAIENISFELKHGERVAVIGPNGAGKTTLFQVIAGLLKPSAGNVQIFGNDPEGHNCIGYVPQRSQVDWNFPVNVADVVMMGRIGRLGLLRHPGSNDKSIVEEALRLVNLTDLSKKRISHLSGGQQQRVFIARTLAQEATLLLMDEPFTGLDISSRDDIFTILELLQERGVSVMVSLHDLNIASENFTSVMLLNKHLYGFGSPSDVFRAELLEEAYGGRLHLLKGENGILALGDTCCNGKDHEH